MREVISTVYELADLGVTVALFLGDGMSGLCPASYGSAYPINRLCPIDNRRPRPDANRIKLLGSGVVRMRDG
jgi:hypothetical protein